MFILKKRIQFLPSIILLVGAMTMAQCSSNVFEISSNSEVLASLNTQIKECAEASCNVFNEESAFIFSKEKRVKVVDPGVSAEVFSIYYSLNDSAFQKQTSNGFIISATATIKWYAVLKADESFKTGIKSQHVIIDTIAPAVSSYTPGGTYENRIDVNIDITETSEYKVYYTLDETEPGVNSNLYTGSLSIYNNGKTTLKFIAIDQAGNRSEIKTAVYIIVKTAPTVQVTPASGSYTESQNIFLGIEQPFKDDPDSKLCYTVSTTTTPPADPVAPSDCINANTAIARAETPVTAIAAVNDVRIIKYFTIGPDAATQTSAIKQLQYVYSTAGTPMVTINSTSVAADANRDIIGLDSPYDSFDVKFAATCNNSCTYKVTNLTSTTEIISSTALAGSGIETSISINSSHFTGSSDLVTNNFSIEVTDTVLAETGSRVLSLKKDARRPEVEIFDSGTTTIFNDPFDAGIYVTNEVNAIICYHVAEGRSVAATNPGVSTAITEGQFTCSSGSKYSDPIELTYLNNKKSNYQIKAIARDAAGNLSEASGTAVTRNFRLIPGGMVRITSDTTSQLWIDSYEASIHSGIKGNPDGSATTAKALSKALAYPAQNISYWQAKKACENSGKRLCTTTEWKNVCSYGTTYTYPYGNTYNDVYCNTFRDFQSSQFQKTGSRTLCRTPEWIEASSGSNRRVYDMSGNLHEFTSEEVTTGIYRIKGGSYLDGYQQDTENPPQVTCGTGSDFSVNALWQEQTVGFRCCFDED